MGREGGRRKIGGLLMIAVGIAQLAYGATGRETSFVWIGLGMVAVGSFHVISSNEDAE